MSDSPCSSTAVASLLDALPFSLPEPAAGEVWLVGAGPGHPGLLTLQGLSVLSRAEIVLYDALSAPEMLSLAPPGCQLESVGKRGGKASPGQKDITARLIEEARAGRKVIRLKGGDPFLFGRGAEEAMELTAAGIPVRIVPGISAATGGLALAGIPLTSRDCNSAVTLMTAHDRHGNLPALFGPGSPGAVAPVLVVFMGLSRIGEIAASLLEAGRAPGTPVAVLSRAACPDQHCLQTTLEACERETQQAGLQSPALIVVGPVARLAESLAPPLEGSLKHAPLTAGTTSSDAGEAGQ